jgi:hypothetical protein
MTTAELEDLETMYGYQLELKIVRAFAEGIMDPRTS